MFVAGVSTAKVGEVAEQLMGGALLKVPSLGSIVT